MGARMLVLGCGTHMHADQFVNKYLRESGGVLKEGDARWDKSL